MYLFFQAELQRIEKEIKDYQESLAILKTEEEKEREIDKKIAAKREVNLNSLFVFKSNSTTKQRKTELIRLFRLSKMLGRLIKVKPRTKIN